MTSLEPISLSQGIPCLNSDETIRKFVINAIRTGKADKYSEEQGIGKVRGLISRQLLEEGMEYDPDEIILTTGAIEAIHSIFLSLQSKGKTEILIPTPAYSRYFKLGKLANIQLIELPLDRNSGWRLDLDLFKKKITKHTKAILICNPNNPTGNIFPKETLLQVCSITKEIGIKVILDDIYSSICFEEGVYNPCINPEFKKTVIRVVSLSKTYSLTGWRIGYIHSDNKNIQKILPVHGTITICAPVVSQYAAMAALLTGKQIIKETLPVYRRNRKIMGRYLMRMPQLKTIWPQGTYYFFPKVAGLTDSRRFCEELKRQQNLTLYPGADFGTGGEGHLRLCFGKTEEEIHEGMRRLQKFLNRNTILGYESINHHRGDFAGEENFPAFSQIS